MMGTVSDGAARAINVMEYDTIIVEHRGPVTIIEVHRPEVLNALSGVTTSEIISALLAFSSDDDQRCAVLTGSRRAFAAGADIGEMAPMSFAQAYRSNFGADWDKVARIRKPWIAAVSGYALGGGAEVAMMADIIIASHSAQFGLPEVTLGISPGWGGTQRLARGIGKSKAMQICLTGRRMDAAEAERCGLVAKVVGDENLIDEAVALAAAIVKMSPLALVAAKELVNAAFETPLSNGLRLERQMHRLVATENATGRASGHGLL